MQAWRANALAPTRFTKTRPTFVGRPRQDGDRPLPFEDLLALRLDAGVAAGGQQLHGHADLSTPQVYLKVARRGLGGDAGEPGGA